MTGLPPAIAAWSRELAGLAPELVAALTPWLGRLSLAIGPLAHPRGAPSGELDGVEGLARRGSYERLLMTEWAIGLELPDEFLRRAGGGEHLFIAQARLQPAASRRSVAIVSAGPSQLGAPRLVHLAALIVLARRAAAAGAGFAWGVLEAPDHGLVDGVAPAALVKLLAARTAATASTYHAHVWATLLRGVDGDRWVIADRVTADAARLLRAAALRVRDPLEPGVAALDVEVTAAHATTPRARVRLPLPTPDEGARLIRDPFRTATATPAATPAAGELRRLWFLPGSRRLALDHGDRFELWPLPSSPRDAPGKPRRVLAFQSTLIALGARRRVPVAVTWSSRTPRVLLLHDARLGPSPVHVEPPPFVIELLAAGRHVARATPGTCAYLDLHPLSQRSRPPVLVIDGPCGALLAVDEPPRVGGAPAKAKLLGLDEDFDETEVLGATVYGEGLVFAALRPGGEVQVRAVTRRGVHLVASTSRRGHAGTSDDPGVRFGCHVPMTGGWDPIAVRVDDRRWDVVGLGSAVTLTADKPVHGVVYWRGEPRLVTLHDDRTRVQVGTFLLPGAGAPIEHVAVSPSSGAIAWSTRTEIVVYSLAFEADILRIPRAHA